MQHQLTVDSLFDSDSRRYKALGNSLAIPCALRVLDGIAEVWKGATE